MLFCVFLAFYHFTPAATPSPRHATEPLLIDVGPKRFVSETTQNERFLSYNTHSGYHNQRIALENALTLAKLLDRTLLLPPARLGSAVPWIQYEKLRFRLEQSNKAGLDHCTHFSRTGILPRECIGYFDWTMVNWDLFVDVDHIQNTLHQPLIDRWNDTDAWLEDHLGLDLNQDVYTFPEKDLYAYRFYDSLGDDEALDKFKQRVELQDLKAIPHRLLQLGSLFGTSRLRTVEEDNWEVRSSFRQAMVFRNPTLDRITDHIRDRLGGDTAYYAVHMRVGDGVFRTEAKSNVVAVLRQLLEEKMGLHSTTVGDALRLFASDFLPSPHLNKRSSPSLFNNVTEGSPSLIKRARNSRPQRPGAYNVSSFKVAMNI